MQNTRLTLITRNTGTRLQEFLSNPWRRLSAIAIAALLGIFLGSAIPTTTGQRANLDVPAAALMLLFIELANLPIYRRRPDSRRTDNRPPDATPANTRRPVWLDLLLSVKLGLTFGLFVEAFKLGS